MSDPDDGGAGPAGDAVEDVLVDDVRSFADGRPCRLARTLDDGLALLGSLAGHRVRRLWLDHDLGVDPRTGVPVTVMPLVVELVSAAGRGQRYPVDEICVHTGSETAAERMTTVLAASGYRVRRWTDRTFWA